MNPEITFALRDGLLALSANELLAVALAGLILSRRWLARDPAVKHAGIAPL